jgi:hypothetical protein
MNTTNIITKQIIEKPRPFVADNQLDLFEANDDSAGADSPSPPSSFSLHPSSLPNRRRWLKLATSDVDRAGDILLIEGMDSGHFEKNPQFLWQHGKSGAMVNTIGRVVQLQTTGNALFALVEYAPADTNPLAEQVFQMDVLGLLPANSIGFRPIEWEANDFGGHTFTQWELIECSKVELPMNPEAVDGRATDSAKSLVLSAKSIDEAAAWLTQ